MASFEFLAITLTGLGLMASIIYYSTILRNANKTRELQLQAQKLAAETRQAQLFMQSYRETSTIEIQQICSELMSWEWTDFNDFNTKYLLKPEKMGKYVTFMLYWHGLGILLHEKYIPKEMLYKMDQNGAASIMYWTKFKQVSLDMRRARNQPNLWKYFENYVEEMIELRRKEGLFTVWSLEENRFIEKQT